MESFRSDISAWNRCIDNVKSQLQQAQDAAVNLELLKIKHSKYTFCLIFVQKKLEKGCDFFRLTRDLRFSTRKNNIYS